MDRFGIVSLFVGIILLVLGITGVIYAIADYEDYTGDKIVPCYDKYGHKMIDQQCIEESNPSQEGLFMIITLFLGIIIVGIGFIIGGIKNL